MQNSDIILITNGIMMCANMTDSGIEAIGSIAIQVEESDDAPITLDAPGIEGYIIGRSDVSISYMPDIDLAPFEAQNRGISRRHAALVRRKGQVHVVDLGSMNGTFVNNKRLSPQSAHVLADGDRLSLANLHMVITQVRS